MAKKPPPIAPDEPGDDDQLDETEFAALLAEAHELGVHYTRQGRARDIHELRAFVALARQDHGADHPVPCYGVSYDPTDRSCRICSLRAGCADRDTSPRVEVLGVKQLEDVACESCGRGTLSEELIDQDTKELLDFRCTTVGCSNTLGAQCGWDESVGRRPVISLEEPSAEPEPEQAAPPDARPEAPVTAESSKPKLEVLPGGKSKKKVTVKKAPAKKKKVTVKKAEPKKASKKKASKKKVEPKKKASKKKVEPAPKPAPKPTGFKADSGGLQFRFGEDVYDSLTAIAKEITGTRNWSGFKFFKVKKADLKVGLELSRDWEGETYTVIVEDRDDG